jgi:hypothetical protein
VRRQRRARHALRDRLRRLRCGRQMTFAVRAVILLADVADHLGPVGDELQLLAGLLAKGFHEAVCLAKCRSSSASSCTTSTRGRSSDRLERGLCLLCVQTQRPRARPIRTPRRHPNRLRQRVASGPVRVARWTGRTVSCGPDAAVPQVPGMWLRCPQGRC